MPKLSALLQTSGQAQYTDDMPITPGTLFAAFAVSTVGPATLAGLDLSVALSAPGGRVVGCALIAWLMFERMAGVARVITADGLPGANDFMAVPLVSFFSCLGK